MKKAPSRETAYSIYLYYVIGKLLASRGGGFTLKELAAFSGLKLTQNMRRRVNHSVAAGLLKVQTIPQGMRGRENVFTYPSVEKGMDIPF